jgi:hypothetical protein
MGLSSCGVIRRGSGLCVLEHLKNGRWTPGDYLEECWGQHNGIDFLVFQKV